MYQTKQQQQQVAKPISTTNFSTNQRDTIFTSENIEKQLNPPKHNIRKHLNDIENQFGFSIKKQDQNDHQEIFGFNGKKKFSQKPSESQDFQRGRGKFYIGVNTESEEIVQQCVNRSFVDNKKGKKTYNLDSSFMGQRMKTEILHQQYQNKSYNDVKLRNIPYLSSKNIRQALMKQENTCYCNMTAFDINTNQNNNAQSQHQQTQKSSIEFNKNKNFKPIKTACQYKFGVQNGKPFYLNQINYFNVVK